MRQGSGNDAENENDDGTDGGGTTRTPGDVWATGRGSGRRLDLALVRANGVDVKKTEPLTTRHEADLAH